MGRKSPQPCQRIQKSFDEMARQSELDELRKEIEELRTHQVATESHIDLNSPPTSGLPESGPEPRAGEFQVTESPAMAATEQPRQ